MIRIGERWAIDAEPMCYILKEIKIIQKGDNAGKERETIEGYFSSICDAVKRIYDKELMEKVASTDLDLKSIVAEMRAVEEEVMQKISKAEICNVKKD